MRWIRQSRLWVLFLMVIAFTSPALAADPSKSQQKGLNEIREELKKLNQKLDLLIQGQKNLSEEHTGLRVRLHRKG